MIFKTLIRLTQLNITQSESEREPTKPAPHFLMKLPLKFTTHLPIFLFSHALLSCRLALNKSSVLHFQ